MTTCESDRIPTYTKWELNSQPSEIICLIFRELSNLDIVRMLCLNSKLRALGTQFLTRQRLPKWIRMSSSPQQAFTRAAREGDPVLVKLMLENSKVESHYRDWQALDMAIENKHMTVVRFLLKHDSKVSSEELFSRFLKSSTTNRLPFLVEAFSPSHQELFEIGTFFGSNCLWARLDFLINYNESSKMYLSDSDLKELQREFELSKNWYALSIILCSPRTSDEDVVKYLRLYGICMPSMHHVFENRQVPYDVVLDYLDFLEKNTFTTTLINVLVFQKTIPLEVYIEYINKFESMNHPNSLVRMLLGRPPEQSTIIDRHLPEDVVRRCLATLNKIGKLRHVVNVLIHYSDMLNILDVKYQDESQNEGQDESQHESHFQTKRTTFIEKLRIQLDILPTRASEIFRLFEYAFEDKIVSYEQLNCVIWNQVQLGNLNPQLELR